MRDFTIPLTLHGKIEPKALLYFNAQRLRHWLRLWMRDFTIPLALHGKIEPKALLYFNAHRLRHWLRLWMRDFTIPLALHGKIELKALLYFDAQRLRHWLRLWMRDFTIRRNKTQRCISMEFFATNGKRPVRLSEETRRFAFESLNHKYGRLTQETPAVSMEDYAGFAQLTDLQKYDAAIERIAERAPVRICEGEKISGAATLGLAIQHNVPAVFNGGEPVGRSISHLTIDFETVLKKGVYALRDQAEASLEKYQGMEREPFIRSCLHCIRCMEIWHARYLDALRDLPEYRHNYENLQRVPFFPAGNFCEAVQSLWFTFAFVRLCGNWPGIGRIDWLLGGYLERDLARGSLSLEEAREILAHFFIKGCEWVCGGNYGSGDAQHYQNILLAGVDGNGREVTNTVTYLVLDILEELGISDFPTTVRVNRHTDPAFLTRVAEVIRLGGGVLAVYNEDLILDSLTGYGYTPEEARKFANDGCWEVQIPGKTYFSYVPFDSLQVLQKETLKNYDGSVSFGDFQALYRNFIEDLGKKVRGIASEWREMLFYPRTGTEDRWRPNIPCTVVSLFEQGCIEKGLSYLEGGPVYNIVSPHIGGLPDTVNSLYAIKKLVFEEKKVSFPELMSILKNDWEGCEPLRQYALNKYDYFGNDNDEADFLARDILKAFAGICDSLNGSCGFRFPAGISTFGRQIEWSPHRMATPSGKKAGQVLSGNFSPTPGTDREGATAVIRSCCKSDLRRMVSGAALDLKLLPSAVNGENGLQAIVSLICGFVSLGGHFMQLDIADTQILKDAQAHPENYQTLSVRVSGWNARFVTLNKEWQDMIIAQTGSDF